MTTPFSSDDIRKKYISYFVSKQHAEIPAAGLLPNGDSSLLFVNSGMFPLVPYLLGQEHPSGTRLVNYQRCFRTDDIDEVGDQRHTTCFEMLGNRSLGDYFKHEQLDMRYEFLIKEIGLDPSKLYQSVFGGNASVEADNESIGILQEIFKKYGVSAEVGPTTTGKGELGPGVPCDFATQRIFAYSDKNRWQRGNVVGEVGGPDTETFYDTGKPHNSAFGEHCHPNCDCGRFLEIGNSVFMQYQLTEDGWKKIDRQNVDFGGGLERITMVSQNKHTVFETDIFAPYVEILTGKYGVSYEEQRKNIEVITDHTRAIVFLLMDGCMISNKDQGYFLRRLIRRVLTKLHVMGVPSSALYDIVDAIITKLGPTYSAMVEKKSDIVAALQKEENAFGKNLRQGMSYFDKITNGKDSVSGDDAFILQTTYGFPIDLIKELCTERGLALDEAGYTAKVEEHKNISRQGADKKFKSGLGDNSEKTVYYHTATHILQQVLRDVFGTEVKQKGSNNTQERLRFDFSCPSDISKDDVANIQQRVNDIIHAGFIVTSEIQNTQQALSSGAIGLFGEKYPDEVSVYTMTAPDGKIVSKEICAGPHVATADELPRVFVIKECSSIGAGIKRIKAIFAE